MSKNCIMAGVAELLGVELGQSFKITDNTYGIRQSYYRLTEENGCEISGDNTSWVTVSAEVLKWLIMGDVRIVKLPWRPQIGEKYYIPRIAIRPYDRHYCYYWDNSGVDIKRYDMGIVCKTPEEAVALTKKMLAVAKEEKANG